MLLTPRYVRKGDILLCFFVAFFHFDSVGLGFFVVFYLIGFALVLWVFGVGVLLGVLGVFLVVVGVFGTNRMGWLCI